MTALEQQRFKAIVHVVHEYANFVSSAEMVLSGCDIDGVPFKPPINTHVSHAFYVNCRKLADFLQNKLGNGKDDIMAEHYAPGFYAALPVSTDWRFPMNKQLADVTYARDTSAREIDRSACEALEGILLGIACARPREFNESPASPKDEQGKVKPFQNWTLSDFINVARDLNLLGEDVKKFSHALRDFRNYIHPYQQMASNFNPDEHTAQICWKVLQAAITQLSR